MSFLKYKLWWSVSAEAWPVVLQFVPFQLHHKFEILSLLTAFSLRSLDHHSYDKAVCNVLISLLRDHTSLLAVSLLA